VAVDVNTGADTSLAAGLKANIALARDLPRQLRIKGLGGQITLDLAPMPKKDRRGFETVLNREFRTTGPRWCWPAGRRLGITSCSANAIAGRWRSSGLETL
jgi:Ribonuclease G/E